MINNTRLLLRKELVKIFHSHSIKILAAREIDGYNEPSPLFNDGYGDQKEKSPDIIGYDKERECYVLGIVKTETDNLESLECLTEYDVFFDHHNSLNKKSSRVYYILPPSRIEEFTAIITHYIHREYWGNLVIVRSLQQ